MGLSTSPAAAQAELGQGCGGYASPKDPCLEHSGTGRHSCLLALMRMGSVR